MGVTLSLYANGSQLYGVTAEMTGRAVSVLECRKLEGINLFSQIDPFRINANPFGPEIAEETITQSTLLPDEEEMKRLREFLSGFEHHWVRAALIVPPHDYLSVQLELPFSDSKSIAQVLELEVQDRVPFSTSDFLLQPSTTGVKEGNLFEIHVSLIPKLVVERTLAVARSFGVEPAVLTTAPSVLAALPYLSPTYFAENAAYLMIEGKRLYLSVNIEGETKSIFSPPDPSMNGTAELEKAALESALQGLRLFLVSCEERYGARLEKVYLIGSARQREIAQQVLGKQCENISSKDFFNDTPDEFLTAVLGSVYATDIQPPPILVNFRHGEYRYRPQLEGLLEGARQLVRPLLAFALCLVLSLGAVYWSRAERLSTIQAKLQEQVARVVGTTSIPAGEEFSFVRSSVERIRTQLEEVSSTAPQSSIVILLEVARIMKLFPKIEVDSLRIVPNSVMLKGKADSFTSVDSLRNELKKEHTLFCEVVDRSKTFGNEVNVDFTLIPCGA